MDIRYDTLASLSVDGRGSYGIGAAAVERSEDLYTYLRITDIRDDGTLDMNNMKSVNDEKASQYFLKPNDIVFARTGASTGRNYFYDGSDGEFVYAGFLIKFSIDPMKVNPKYVKYYCMSDAYKGWIKSFNTGSTRGNINAQILGGMPVPIPSRLQQDGIVNVLTSLDDKIRINKEINDNLLKQITACFHHYFDAYEASTDAIGLLGDVAQFKYGTMPKKDKLGNGEYVAFSGYQVVGSYPEKMYSTPQLIVVARGVGGCGDIKYTPSNCYLTNLSIAIISKNTAIEDYLFNYLRLHDTKVMNTGSAQPQITVSTLEKYQLPIPPEDLLASFSAFVQPFKILYRENKAEIERLQMLRDTLVPRLMSGELDVSNVDI